MARRSTPAPPLDAQALERLALRYVERYATTRAKLTRYLERKLYERGVDGERPDIAGLVAHFAELGYVDDRAFAEARAASMARRGLGARRVSAALWQAGISEEDAEAVAPDIAASRLDSAVRFARRRRIGPFAEVPADRDTREKHIARMVRAGHGFDLARTIAGLDPGDDIGFLSESDC